MEIKHYDFQPNLLLDLKRLYYGAFPPQERIPLGLLLVNSLRRKGKFHFYLHQGDLLGFAYTIDKAELYYILLLAVDEKYRSQGCGSQILRDLKKRAEERPQLITIEPIEKNAVNFQQRLRRLNFYQRQGFRLTSHTYQEADEVYQIISTDSQPNVEIFRKLMIDFFHDKVSIAVD